MTQEWRKKTEAQKVAAIKRLAKSKCGKVDASKKLGIHLTTLYNFINDHGIEWKFKATPGRKEQNFPTKEIAEFYQAGNTLRATARKFGIDIRTARSRVVLGGVDIRVSPVLQAKATLAQNA